MQKKIIALAVAGLVSGAAFAQTNVTISGVLDAGLASTSTQGNNGAVEGARYNNSATSSLWIRAQEDLGGGMKAGASLETQPFATSTTNGSAGLGEVQHYVWIGGNFGTISAGKMNTYSLTAATTAQPFGTTLGGGYGNQLSATDTRHEGVVQYDSPNLNGFTVGLMLKPKNTNHTTGNSYGYTNLGAKYSAGPLNVAFAHAKADNITGAGTGTLKHTLLGANYNFGAFTAYAGLFRSKGDAALTAGAVGTPTTLVENAAAPVANSRDRSSWSLGVKWMATSNIAVSANYLRADDKSTTNTDDRVIGLGVDYSLSKRTAAYVRYDNTDTDRQNSAAGKTRTAAIGLRHSF